MKIVPGLTSLMLVILPIFSLSAQIDSTNQKIASFLENGYLNGYGIVNYYNFDWETDPDRRSAFDAERLNLYLGYHFNDKIEFKSEIEYEHGGTGATMEFDVLEEFGEFEQSIEAGGAVILEQINLLFKIKPWLNVRLGKFRFYMGNASKQDDPTEYFTSHRSEVENTILPLGWYEHGIELSGSIFKNWEYKLYLINGLDATGFSSANWVRRGYQKRFETVNANDLAIAGRLDYKFGKVNELGVSFYSGNSTGNRPKADTQINGQVSYADIHWVWDSENFRGRAYGMYGHLNNSEAISELNKNLSNNLDVKRTAVGSAAMGYYVELAYNLLSFTKNTKQSNYKLFLFGRYEYYDSMFKVEGNVFDNPRWERNVRTVGLNYFPHPQVVLKMQFSNRVLGSDEKENTFSSGIGFKI